jgi:hypothetical protein
MVFLRIATSFEDDRLQVGNRLFRGSAARKQYGVFATVLIPVALQPDSAPASLRADRFENHRHAGSNASRKLGAATRAIDGQTQLDPDLQLGASGGANSRRDC